MTDRIRKARNYGTFILNLWWSWRKADLAMMIGIQGGDTIPFVMQVELSVRAMKNRLSRLLGKGRETEKDIL